jgi:hypothetical protein
MTAWTRWSALVLAVLGGVALVTSLVGRHWLLALLAGVVLAGSLLEVRRSRPTAVRERARQDEEAAAAWPPQRLWELAAERGLDVGDRDDQVALVAELRRREPRLGLSRAVDLVRRLGSSPHAG